MSRHLSPWLRPCPGQARVCFRATLLVALLATHGLSIAEDLGIKAGTYLPDPDGREELKDAVRAREQSGELAKFWSNYRDKVVNAIRHPAPLQVRSNYKQHTEFHDVAFTLPSDFVDQNGTVVAHKGQVIEPLAILPLTSALVFIDGRDQRQVDWAVHRGQLVPTKIILTGGSILELRERYRDTPWRAGKGVPFYMDQRAMIISSLERMYGIRVQSVPVALTQQGKGLRIDYGMRDAQ